MFCAWLHRDLPPVLSELLKIFRSNCQTNCIAAFKKHSVKRSVASGAVAEGQE